MKTLGLGYESFDLLRNFIQNVIVEQKYEKILFRNDFLNVEYILKHMFYLTDYSNKYYLNEVSCK